MPAQKHSILTLSVLATELVLEKQAIGYNGEIATAGSAMMGIADENAEIGEQIPVDMLGTSSAISGGAIPVGEALEVGTAGKLIAYSEGIIVARAMHSTAASDENIEIFLTPN